MCVRNKMICEVRGQAVMTLPFNTWQRVILVTYFNVIDYIQAIFFPLSSQPSYCFFIIEHLGE